MPVINMDRERERLRSISGSGGGGMESRIARLEAHVDHIQSDTTEIKSDIRAMLNQGKNAFILIWAGIFGMVAIMAKGFGWF